MKQKWRDIRPYVLPGIIYGFANIVLRTVRIETVGWEEAQAHPGGKVYAVWHGRTMIGAYFLRGRGTWTIISNSNDGDMQNKIFHRFGFRTIRGSTKRGGISAAIESIRALKDGGEMAITPDGPRGPSGIVQEGVVLMARKSGVPIIPCAVSSNRRWLAKSWDHYLIPKPFSKAVIVFGAPLTIDLDASEAEQEEFRSNLEREMHQAERLAEGMMGQIPPTWHQSPYS